MTDETETTKPVCGARANLIVTLTPDGTATNVARQRITVSCFLALGHAGPHIDPMNAEQWDAPPGATPTLVRQEEEPA